MNKNARFILAQYRRRRRFAVLRGGTRSGKTYAALQFLLLGLLAREFERVSVVAPTVPHLRRGALRDFLAIAEPYIRNKMFRYNKVEGIIHFGNAFIEFFSTDSPDRLRGAGREVVFMNEANTHPVEAFDELEVRTEKFMILDFNPTAEFWLTERFRQMGLSLRAHEIVTTYRDNPYLPTSQVRSIERRRGIAGWWRVYGEGRYGEPTGVAWYNWEVGDVEERGEHILGVDFGQGASPTAIVAVRREDGERFTAWELAYGNISLR
ncbi:MAG: phage terminase large subunit, partial [bacterium]|nr:phage terminase large subunit [bacterium]